jgi:hypothetical protein
MNRQNLEKVFSSERLKKYFDAHPGDDAKAMIHYHSNLQISEAFYPSLSILEVALRNSLNQQLIARFGVPDWYSHFPTTPGLSKLNKEITKAQQFITHRGEQVKAPKVVAELTLGFWVRLFNAEYERILWKDLRRAFPNLPKQQRQRKNVSAPLNRFRNLRNRIFHNEAICWNLHDLEKAHLELVTLLSWINRDLPLWLQPVDRFDAVLQEVKKNLK